LSDMDESVPLENKLGPSQVDFIVCPTAPTIPPLLQEVSKQTSVDTYMNDIFTVPASLAGLPAISVPCFLHDKDQRNSSCVPIGMQIIGQFADDFGVLGVARILKELLREPPGIVRFITPPPQSKNDVSSKGDRPLRITKFKSIKGDEPLRIKRYVSGEGDEPLRVTKFKSDKEDEPLPIRQVQVTGQVRTTKIASDRGARNPTTNKEIEKELEDSLESWEWILSPPGRSDHPS
jgi:aspartyl-tRNA(Asn)/glutamyl-tRNA(Gln) amidotransferase subunit A